MANLGTKLQSAYQKVNTKLSKQLGSVVFRKATVTKGSKFGMDYASSSNVDVTLSSGVEVIHVKAAQTQEQGTLRAGDIRVIVPGNLITDAQIDGADIIYDGITYSVIDYQPKEVYGAKVVRWEVLGRQEGE